MAGPSQNRSRLTYPALWLAFAATLVAIALAYPRTVSDPLLGAEWQCRRAAFLTSCTRLDRIEPVVHGRRGNPVAPRRA